MKTMTLLLALLPFAASSALAQDPKGGEALAEVHSAKKEEKKPAVTPPKPADQVLGKTVTYGGFFTDFVRAEKKRPLFSLRTPIDPKKDLENIWFYPNTDKISGVVLFSIKF